MNFIGRKNGTNMGKIGIGESVRPFRKEEYLLNQIEELKGKAKQLQEKLSRKEKQISELRHAATAPDGKHRNFDEVFQSKKEEAELLFAGFSSQIQDMMDSIDQQITKLDGKAEDSFHQIDEKAAQQLEEMKTSVQELNTQVEAAKNEIFDRIHSENVKCYRNIKSLFDELYDKMEQSELNDNSIRQIRKSFKGMKFFSFFAFADCIILILIILYKLGVFDGINIFGF